MIQMSNSGKYYFNGNEITEESYNEIVTIIQNKPTPREGYDYRLLEDLTWQEYKIEPEPESDPVPEEILDILLGGEHDDYQ